MTSPNWLDWTILEQLLRAVSSATAINRICDELKVKRRKEIFTAPIVIWLMIYQRLHCKGTLSAAVHFLVRHAIHWQDRAGACKRVVERRISSNPGRYCQARLQLPTMVASPVCDHIFEQLQGQMRVATLELARPVFIIDGTTLRLAHEPELKRAFPPGRNQHGENHWPTMLVVAFHDAQTGLAMRPSWGAMYGKNNVSEQQLAREALGRLPADAIAMADCNFGIFWFAHEAHRSHRDMLLRLTKSRAQSIVQGQKLCAGRRYKVQWQASHWDRKHHKDLPAEAVVTGWMVACRHPQNTDEMMYFFTTLDLIAKRILAIYKLRWNVETDLRQLKRTLELHQITAKSKAMVEKELLMGICAYNVVRAVMYLSATKAGLVPRQISFSAAQDAVMAAWPYLERARNQAEFQAEIERLLEVVARHILPKRSGQRSYPRAVWNRGDRFPLRRTESKGVE